MKKNLVMGLLVVAMPFASLAQSSTSSTTSSTTDSTVKKSDVVPADAGLKDVDQEITNAKLRAETGSKKKWSFRSSFNYNGSSVEKPLHPDRPRMTGSQVVSGDTGLSGSLGVKYRATDRDSLSLRAGINLRRPLGGDISDKFEAADPYLTWERLNRVGNIQLVTSASVEASTAKHKVDQNMVSAVNFAQTAMYDFGNGLEMGGVIDLNNYFYNAPMANGALDTRDHYEIGLYPMVEYAFSDKVSFRTVFRYGTYTSRRHAPDTYRNIQNTQSVGVGVSVARDIYMYPNIQFDPSNLRPSQTNWGLSTSINL